MNRRGKVFTFGLLITYLVVATTALIILTFTIGERMPEHKLGTYQGALLNAYNRADAKLHYLEGAAALALDKAVKLLYDDPQTFFTFIQGDSVQGLECGGYAYPLWNDRQKQCLGGADATQKVLDALAPRALEYLAGYTTTYPDGGFNVDYTFSAVMDNQRLKVRFDSNGPLEEPIMSGLARGVPKTEVPKLQAAMTGTTVMNALAWPGESGTITSCFGPRIAQEAASDFHAGLDLAATPVHAAASGVVLNDPRTTKYSTLVIEHTPQLRTRYLHIDKGSLPAKIVPGATVEQGELLGMASNVGCADQGCGKHIHFEVLVKAIPGDARVKGKVASKDANAFLVDGFYAVNPVCFLEPERIASANVIGGQASCGRQADWRTTFCSQYGFDIAGMLPSQTVPVETPEAKPPEQSTPNTQPAEPAQPAPAQPAPSAESAVSLTPDQLNYIKATTNNMAKYGWEPLVIKASSETNVPAALMKAFFTKESKGDPAAIGATEDAGIAQFHIENCQDPRMPRVYFQQAGFSSPQFTCCGCKKSTRAPDPACGCTMENDDRLKQERAIPAQARLILESYNQFAGNKERIKFTIIAYNFGAGRVKTAIAKLGGDPSYEEVAAYLQKNYGYDADKYVLDVYAYYQYWGGAATIAADAQKAAKVEEIKENLQAYGDISYFGVYAVKPDLLVDAPDELTPFITFTKNSMAIVDQCADADVPGACLVDQAKAAKLAQACEEDPAIQYFIELYQAIRDCSENSQFSCGCELPHTPNILATEPHRYDFVINQPERKATLLKDGAELAFFFEDLSTKNLRIKTGDSDSFVPWLLNVTLTTGKEGVKTRIDYARLATEKGTQGTLSRFTLVKERDLERLIFTDASSAPACAPVKTKHLFCGKPLDGKPLIKFGLTLKDRQKPAAIPTTQLDLNTGMLSFAASESKDLAFYNLFEQGEPRKLYRQFTSPSSFATACFAGMTLGIAPVDLAGNEGEPVTVAIPDGTRPDDCPQPVVELPEQEVPPPPLLAAAPAAPTPQPDQPVITTPLEIAYREMARDYSLPESEEVLILLGQEQKMYLVNGAAGKVNILKTYVVSTATNGFSNVEDSYGTPTGVLKIAEKIGDRAPIGEIFEARQDTGRVAAIYEEPYDIPEDAVTTRILWLDGQEPENKNAHQRYIYIHGTPEEGLLGTPASHGCIRMKNTEVAELFDRVESGTYLNVVT